MPCHNQYFDFPKSLPCSSHVLSISKDSIGTVIHANGSKRYGRRSSNIAALGPAKLSDCHNMLPACCARIPSHCHRSQGQPVSLYRTGTLTCPSVDQIWALVRAAAGETARTRVLTALKCRHIILTPAQLHRLNALPSDLSAPNLGRSPSDLNTLLSTSTTTTSISSARSVNFNLFVLSFERQNIRGTHDLLNFSLRSHLPFTARLCFCSSTSTASAAINPATNPDPNTKPLLRLAHTNTLSSPRRTATPPSTPVF